MGVIGFLEKLEQVYEGKVQWEINEANANEAKNDDEYVKYKNCW